MIRLSGKWRRPGASALSLMITFLLIQCGEPVQKRDDAGKAPETFDSLDVAILWDAMTAVNGAANMAMFFRHDNRRWPQGMNEIVAYARMSSFPYYGRSALSWWTADMDTSLLVVATSALSMPHGAGKVFTYDIKNRSYRGYGLTTGSGADTKEDSLRIAAAFSYGESILHGASQDE